MNFNKEDYLDYLRILNAQDFRKLADTYWDEDIVCETTYARIEGREKFLLNFLKIHHSIEEYITPLRVLQDGDSLFSDNAVEFHALADRPDFRLGPMKKGERVKARYFILHQTRGKKVSWLRSVLVEPM